MSLTRPARTPSATSLNHCTVRLRARVAQWANEQSRAELSRLPIPLRDHQPRRVALLPICSQLPGC